MNEQPASIPDGTRCQFHYLEVNTAVTIDSEVELVGGPFTQRLYNVRTVEEPRAHFSGVEQRINLTR